ncbi:MAG: YkgJ family cysteine cluster protein, partial [FCB group bacterium]|nr:YkgJ family cysteine cluster protein [FCB group bacterium]
METNLERIKRLSEERDEENWRFRTFLKGRDEDEVDAQVHRLYEEVAAAIDCTACGNCCGVTWPCVSGEDVDRLAKRLL